MHSLVKTIDKNEFSMYGTCTFVQTSCHLNGIFINTSMECLLLLAG